MANSCHVCRRADNLHSHHIFPIAYGGPKDGVQVFLCAICHANIHTAANLVFKGKDNFKDAFTPQEFTQARILIQAIVNSKIQLESSGRPINTIRRLQLEIPQDLFLALHNKKRDSGFSSLHSFIIEALKNAVK